MQRKTKTFFSSLISILLLSLFVLPVRAEGETIPATGEICAQGICNSIQITFPPKGGPVSGTLSGQGSKDGCNFNNEGTISGTFAGGDGGQISGSAVWTMTASCGGNSISQSWSGTWQGTLSANGTGSGDGSVSGVSASWTLSFSGADFQRILAPITKEYFKTTYGLDVVDGSSKWTDRQLVLLDETIKKLPRAFWDKTKFTKIIRNDKYINPQTGAKEDSCGLYRGDEEIIEIYDGASNPFDFSDDPNGELQFTGTLVHEMTHAFQNYKDYKTSLVTYSIDEYQKNPVVRDYQRIVQDDQKNGKTGWIWNHAAQKYEFKGTGQENKLITTYAGTNPYEDMAESVMFYVTEPAKLAATSPNRYNFIKEQIFGGLEYGWDY